MKILMLSTSFPRHEGDWAGIFVSELARALARDHEISVLTPGFPGARPRDSIDGVSIRRFTYCVPSTCQRVIYPDGIPDQLKKSMLARLQVPLFLAAFVGRTVFASSGTHVILCNWIVTGVIAYWAGFLCKRPYIVVVRGSDMKALEKGGAIASLYKKSLRRAAAVCSVADDFVEPLKVMGLSNVHFTPNGVDTDRFAPKQKDARQDGKPIVLYVGTLIERKGVRYLLEALSGVNAKLVLVGEGILENELRDIAGQRGVDVAFEGRVPTESMPGWYAMADLFVLPSLYEGRPNVLIEALASGKACIATDILGSRELIEDGESGFLVKPADSQDLARRIRQVLDDSDIKKKFERNASVTLRKRVPDWSACADNYVEILKKAVGENAG